MAINSTLVTAGYITASASFIRDNSGIDVSTGLGVQTIHSKAMPPQAEATVISTLVGGTLKPSNQAINPGVFTVGTPSEGNPHQANS